uniref:Uncharacterized protein n=1 Tax=Sphaerodactylus townsendi TaxID=933632 RepID=A0ACB8EW13_9SAUR
MKIKIVGPPSSSCSVHSRKTNAFPSVVQVCFHSVQATEVKGMSFLLYLLVRNKERWERGCPGKSHCGFLDWAGCVCFPRVNQKGHPVEREGRSLDFQPASIAVRPQIRMPKLPTSFLSRVLSLCAPCWVRILNPDSFPKIPEGVYVGSARCRRKWGGEGRQGPLKEKEQMHALCCRHSYERDGGGGRDSADSAFDKTLIPFFRTSSSPPPAAESAPAAVKFTFQHCPHFVWALPCHLPPKSIAICHFLPSCLLRIIKGSFRTCRIMHFQTAFNAL